MKNTLYTLLILLSGIYCGFAQNESTFLLDPTLNTTLTTTETTSHFGNSISFSNNGNVLAVGEPRFVGQNNEITGRVQVYENQAGIWVQKGQDITGIDDLLNTFGEKVELSSDGNTLAIYDSQIPINLNAGQTLEDFLGDLFPQYYPYIKVFQFNSGNWVQVGNDFLFNDVLDYYDFSLSANGNTLAIGIKDGVDIYTLNGGTWSQVGSQIPSSGVDMNDKSISLSADGNTIVIGDSFFMDSSVPNQAFIDGEVKVYQNITNTWTQIGNAITETSNVQFFGYSVDISSDGNTIAVASDLATVNDNLSILENLSGVWTSKGSAMQNIESILSIDLLNDGSAIGIGEENGARVVKFDTDWENVNRTIKGPFGSDFGHSLAIADNGNVFAVGAPFLGVGGSNGFVNIYGTNFNRNLIFNGSAEILPVMSNGWTQVQGNTTGNFSPGGAKHGEHYFYANTSDPAEFYQDVDLSSFATQIDTGNKFFSFSGYVRSFNQSNPDEGQAILEYKDSNDMVLDTYDSGPISSIDVWTLFEDTRAVPIGTRSVRVTIFQIRNAGTNNDGYIDDLILQEAPGLLIPDPNFEQALIDLNIDSDGIINGQISQNDPIGVIDLDVISKNIVNLEGIEYFTDLQTLSASNNNLIAVNLSENTNLVTLNLGNNQLTELEVNELSALQELSVSGNLINELSLDSNTNLNLINVSDNDLVNLNVRNGNNLNIPTSNFNALNNPDLLCISVDDEDYSNSTWTNVGNDVSFAISCVAFNPNNLLFNGSAEITPVIGNGWTLELGNTIGTPDKIVPFDGNNHFYANQTTLTEFYQEVDLTSFASEIDTGIKAFRFSGYFNSFDQPNPDESRAVLEYKDANDAVLDTYDTGYIASVNAWTQFEDTRVAPIGTRSVKVILYQKRNTGTNNDGYIDAVAFEEAQTLNVIIPDPNFEQALIDLNIDSDDTINGQMFKTDALGVTSLIMNNLNISSLQGIEAFTDLEILTAVNNNISSLNLGQNTALTSVILIQNNLTTLDVSSNTNLSTLNLTSNAITSLDLTNNTALDILDLTGNALTGLDTSNLVNLTQFRANNNLLTALDLSSNPNLIQVACASNDLMEFNMKNGFNTLISNTFFDASNNPNLTCIQVDDVTYSENTWTIIDGQTDFSTNCSATFINIPDPNFEQVLIDDGIDTDGVINGQMLESDALGVLDLDVSSQNISDLTGIEFFTDLETLSAFDNNLSSIDLSQNSQLISALLAINNLSTIDLSNNPNLISISLNDNNLSTIDLSNNTNLLQVFINQNNLTSIDVSMLTNLENLGVAENNLTDLDISQNPNLFTLFCNDNQLQSLNVQNGNNTNFTNLDAQNNPDLECIQVDDVSFSNNNWLGVFNFDAQMFFSLNCSTLINIPDPNFEQALIDEGIDTDGIINGLMSPSNALGVTFLDVNSLNISDLTGIEFFLDLETLNATNNNLSTIDLSANLALDGLLLGINNLTSIDLSNNTNLVSLVLAENQISNIDLSANTALNQIFIQDNILTELDTNSLPNLAQLNVSQNDLTLLDLSLNTNLTQLLASGNNLISLNLQNGNNTNIIGNDFDTTSNPNLTCIQVDDSSYSTGTWTSIDTQSFFGLDCAPINDDCSFAIPIVLAQDTPGTTNSSTPSGFNPNCEQSGIVIFDVWYEFTAPASGSITLTAIAVETSITAKIALYDDCNTTTPLACDANNFQVNNLNPGQTYYAQVWLEFGASGLMAQNTNTEAGDFTLTVEDSTLSTTGFSDALDFTFYPNPASQYINLECNTFMSSYQIFDINGKAVMSGENLDVLEKQIDVSALSSGIYLLKVDSDKSTSTQKLIIK